MKKNIFNVILVLFCIPYSYLSILIEIHHHTLWGYVFALVAAAILSAQAQSINNKLIVILGNLLSVCSSYYCVLNFATEKWGYFCVPFGPTYSAVIINLLMMFTSYVGWAVGEDIQERKKKRQ